MFEGPEGVERFVDELVKKEILYQESKKKGYENNPDYQKKLEEFKKLTLISLLLEKEIEEKAKVTDKDVKDYYDSHKAEMTTNNQIRASHILVKSEDEAKKILEQVKKGGDFAKIAKEKSIDTGSAGRGGDLGFFSRGQMVPEFEKVAFSLKEGEVGGPAKTQFGYHVIKVTGKKEGKIVEFDKIKDMLTQKVTAEKQKAAFDSYIEGLKKSYNVQKNKESIAAILPPKGKADAPADKPGQAGPKTEGPK
jgi:peptidyl-prolyl cis-trans isomerase C